MKQIAPYYDVIVIGGGPAGSVTARYAAENGASVLILERDREVRFLFAVLKVSQLLALNLLLKQMNNGLQH